MYRFTGVTDSHEFDLYTKPPKEKSILIRLILITVLATGFFSFAIMMCDDSYLLLLQERIAGEHKIFEEGMDLFSASGMFEGIKATYKSETGGETSYVVEKGLLSGGKVLDFTRGGNFECPYNNCYTYMGWQMISVNPGTSNQAKFIKKHFQNWGRTGGRNYEYADNPGDDSAFDREGFGKVDGRYVVATTWKNNGGIAKIGDKLDVYLGNGEIIRCIVGDIKSSGDRNWTKWGHRYDNAVSTIEFVVNRNNPSTKKWYKNGHMEHSNPGNRNCHPEWKSKIVKIMVGGTESTGTQTATATSGWKYLPSKYITKCKIDTSKLSPKRQTIIDCMYWIVRNCWYDQDRAPYNHPGTNRRDNFDTILKDIKDTGYSGADCSSSIHAAYKKAGISVPGTTGGYPSRTSKEINKNDLAPGDILWQSGHIVMFLGWKDKSEKTAWLAAMHGILNGQKPWKDKTGNNCGDIKSTSINGFPRAYRFTPVGSGVSSSSSSTPSISSSNRTSATAVQQSDSTIIIGNQIVVSACKQLGIKTRGSGSAEYVNNKKDSNWIYFGKEHTGISYLNSKKKTLTNGLKKGMPVIILTGTNDTGKAGKIAELANSLGNKGTVYVCTIPPVSRTCRSVTSDNVSSFNSTIKTKANKYKVIDLHSYCSLEDITSSDGSTNYSKRDSLKMIKWIKKEVK